jgi:hypothetical protein
MPGRADFLVVDAVRPNRSLTLDSLLTGKITGNFSLFGGSSSIAIGIRRDIMKLQLSSLHTITGNYL